MKSLSKTIFALYLLILLWLVLFKFSVDILSVLETYRMRNLNLIPFEGNDLREMIDNFIVFIPFGLFLSINLARVELWEKLTYIFMFSLAVEMIQFLLAIGMTDITDVITNTLGGLIGLITYAIAKRYVDNEKLDQFIVIVTAILLIVVILLRFFVFKVRY